MYIHVEYTHVIYVHEKHLKYQLIKPFGSLKITVRGAIHWHLLDELLGELLDWLGYNNERVVTLGSTYKKMWKTNDFP